jgi:hypothetical protein
MKRILKQIKLLSILNIMIVYCIQISSCSSNYQKKEIEEKPKEVNKIEIAYFHFDIMTINDITSEEFEENWVKEATIRMVTNPREIDTIIALFADLDNFENDNGSLDTRVRIKFFYSDSSIETIYISRFFIEKNGIIYKNTEEIVSYLENLMEAQWRRDFTY